MGERLNESVNTCTVAIGWVLLESAASGFSGYIVALKPGLTLPDFLQGCKTKCGQVRPGFEASYIEHAYCSSAKGLQ